MPMYQIRAFAKVSSIETFHVEAESLEAAKKEVEAYYDCVPSNAEHQSCSTLEDEPEFDVFDDPTCEALDDEDGDDDE